MDSTQDPIIAHWLSKISHFWPMQHTLPKRNTIVKVPSEEMQFARVALISDTLFPWIDPPGAYEHSVSVRKLLAWCMQLSGVYLGLDTRGIGRIVRSIYAQRQKNLSTSEDRALDRVEAYKNEELYWEADDARFGPYVDQLFQYINQEEVPGGYIWVDPKEVEWWPEATFDSLVDYRENSKGYSQYQNLLSRHRCMLFAPFAIDTFSKHLQKLPGGDATKYQPMFSRINDVYNRIGLPSPLTVYWSWELLNFVEVAGKNLFKRSLALWSDWPYSALWAPPRPVAYKTAASLSPHEAASFLYEVLWQGIESIFGEVSLDCGLPWWNSVTTFADREIHTPLFYFADPVTPLENPDDYISKKKSDIHPLVKTCLGSENPLSDQLAWGLLEGNLVTLRREQNDDVFRPLYLLLPTVSESVTSGVQSKKIDEDLIEIVDALTFEEFYIAVRAAEIDKKKSSISERAAIWSDTLDTGNMTIEEAIALLPRLGQSDRKRMSHALENLYIPLRRLQVLIERTHAEDNKLQRIFSSSVDITEDSMRQMAFSSLPGVHDLHDALLDSYPYHYLKQPIQNLHNRMDLLLRRGERINTSLNTILAEIAHNTNENQEQWTPRLALLFTFLALLIGLPTFIPQTILSPETYPSWLARYLPLANIEVGARWLAMGVALATVFTLIFYLLAWFRQYWSGHQDEVQRFSALVKQAEHATWNTSDRNKLERLDEKAIQVLAAIWDQHKQEPDKRKTLHRLQWPFRSVQAIEWLRKVRFNQDIINLSVLLPETINTIRLPRTLCILRYKMQISGEPLISVQYFMNGLRKIGFRYDDIVRLDNWLFEEKNEERIEQLEVSTFATILKERGVTVPFEQRMATNWCGPLDTQQEYFDRGNLLAEQRKYEEAIIAYQAVKPNPKNSAYYNALGIAYNRLGNHYEEAINAHKKAIQLAPDNPYWHHNLAICYVMQGKIAEAKQEFQRRIELSPDNALAANAALGMFLIHEGQDEAGSRHLHRAIEIYREQANKQAVMPSAEYRANYLMARIGVGDEQVIPEFRETTQSKQIPLASLKEDLYYAGLLASAPKTPAGIELVVAILKERCGSPRS